MLEIGFFLIGLLAFLLYGWQSVISYRALRWPSAIGTITKSYVETTTNASDHVTEYQAIIKYNYKYSGLTYSGEKGFRKFKGVKWQSEKIIADRPTGNEIIIHINPKKPEQGILQNGFQWASLSSALTGLIFIGFALYIAKI